MELQAMRKQLKKELDKERYEHTKGVMYTAGCLAMAYQYPIETAMIAGLLHDCAKCISNKEKIAICEKNHIPISDIEYANPSLLHGKAGTIIAKEQYHIKSKEILHAIEVHTTGCPNMSVLDKIIFIADYIEPARDKALHLAEIRQLAFQDLDACVAFIARDTLTYLKKQGSIIDPITQQTYDYYCSQEDLK